MHVEWLDALYLLGLRIHWCTYLLTYLHSWFGAYKTGNISETVEDKAKVTINGQYKVVTMCCYACSYSVAQRLGSSIKH